MNVLIGKKTWTKNVFDDLITIYALIIFLLKSVWSLKLWAKFKQENRLKGGGWREENYWDPGSVEVRFLLILLREYS